MAETSDDFEAYLLVHQKAVKTAVKLIEKSVVAKVASTVDVKAVKMESS
jgi:hypothetical protein